MSRPARRVPVATPVYRVALVSGANRGLGFEVARQLSESGMTVLLGARDLDKGLNAARRLAGAAGDVVAVELDITRQDHVDKLAGWIGITYGRLDVLVNNAGGHYDQDGCASHGDIDAARNAMDTHLFGSWRLTSAMLPLMRRHDYGRIVNVSSVCAAADTTSPFCVAYRTSKAALNAYTRTLAENSTAAASWPTRCARAGSPPSWAARVAGRWSAARPGSSGPPRWPAPRRPGGSSAMVRLSPGEARAPGTWPRDPPLKTLRGRHSLRRQSACFPLSRCGKRCAASTTPASAHPPGRRCPPSARPFADPAADRRR